MKKIDRNKLEFILVKNSFTAMLDATLKIGDVISKNLTHNEKKVFNLQKQKLKRVTDEFRNKITNEDVFELQVNDFIMFHENLIDYQMKTFDELEKNNSNEQ